MIMAGCSSNFAVAGCANVRKEIVLGNQKTNLIRLSFRVVVVGSNKNWLMIMLLLLLLLRKNESA